MTHLKRILTLVLIIMAATSICCEAYSRKIPIDEIAIGGIQIHSSEEYVRSIYGEPDKITYSSDRVYEHMKTYDYGGSFIITFYYGKDESKSRVIGIKSTANNGLQTPPGFTVGTSFNDVIKYYGNDLKCVSVKNGKREARYWDGEYISILYKSDENGKIDAIAVIANP